MQARSSMSRAARPTERRARDRARRRRAAYAARRLPTRGARRRSPRARRAPTAWGSRSAGARRDRERVSELGGCASDASTSSSTTTSCPTKRSSAGSEVDHVDESNGWPDSTAESTATAAASGDGHVERHEHHRPRAHLGVAPTTAPARLELHSGLRSHLRVLSLMLRRRALAHLGDHEDGVREDEHEEQTARTGRRRGWRAG